ncbi:MAG: tRNA uridine(34) 5-carboxymethylaminomethyl modification radical SAM/GNAT enzyme Elp3 [Myxococcota bacterium]|nr:tRNA uridine(34) 5-carboxymethylaminomethyl modification radical SAM/GNAT enzyme Elp3 [Myxococcota bacterium]
MQQPDWDRFEYDPMGHRHLLVPLIEKLLRKPPITPEDWRRLLRQFTKPDGGFFSKSEIIAGFRALRAVEAWSISEAEFLLKVKKKPTRTQSGVAPVTVLTKPYPCPGQCIFCPNDVRMPKSYIAEEPGAQRAANNQFDPYAQTFNRLLAFHRMGHPVDKVELIVLGGTWSSYPRAYQIYFMTRCFEAANDFDARLNPDPYSVTYATPDFVNLEEPMPLTPAEGESLNAYNRTVSRHLRSHHAGQLLADREQADWARLFRAHRRNEDARCRVVGLVVETRPDEIDEAEAMHLRRLGATKIQIGIQSLSDQILTMNRRGHTVDGARRAVSILRRAGFKIHAHWMANLYGATVQTDIVDYGKLYSDPAICPDELKLYPCSLIPHTELMTHFEAKRWRPYTRDELLELLVEVMPQTPEYCRLSRVIRDIPTEAIHSGNGETNFREVAERALAKRGIQLREIRAREIKLKGVQNGEVQLRATTYETTVSTEHFLAAEIGQTLLGFCRLSLPHAESITPELEGAAMIREVHVYGLSRRLGQGSGGHAQHRGLGTRLVEWAAQLAHNAQYETLAVISAIGTRGYYRKLGFEDGELYMHRALGTAGDDGQISTEGVV